jgi:hypothetical protein
MKKLLIITLLFSHFSIFAFDDGSDKIIKKYLKAIGGAKEWEGIKTLQIVRHEEDKSWAKSNLLNKISILRDKGYRHEVILGTGSPTIVGFYDDKGWIASNMFMMGSVTGNEKLDSIMQVKFKINKKDQIRDLDNGGIYKTHILKWQTQMPWNFIDYESKGYKTNYKGDSKISIDDVSEIEMISSTGDTTNYFFNKKSDLLLKVIYKESELNFSDYKQVNKIKVPHQVVETTNSFFSTITPHSIWYIIDQVKLNEPMDEKIFMKPKQ